MIQAPTNYTPYHIHSMLSNGTTNIDSITDFRAYVSAAKECGMEALGISEHGNIFEWVHKKEAIETAGMKYLHCVEAYLTEDCDENCVSYSAIDLLSSELLGHDVRFTFRHYWQNEEGAWLATVDEHPNSDMVGKTVMYSPSDVKKEYTKTRDNYHCVLIAKNHEGVKELNKLVSKSFCRNDYHFYYMPRISFEELFNTTDNIIVTTACLGGVLHNGTDIAKERFLGFLRQNKHRCFLEIQHHNCNDQIEYNRILYNLSKSIEVPLIAGTDTHALNDEHMQGRAILQKSKNVNFANEDEWDLTFKSVEQLIEAYEKQNSLPMEIVYEAIENTNIMADMVETFKLDYSPKYPKLYKDSEAIFKDKISQGVINRGIMNLPNYQEYLDRIRYEFDTYKHNNAIDFMLLEEDYKSEMRRRNIKFGYSRGSVSGSIIAYLLGITEVDSIKFNLNFERFMNKERISLADIDTDWFSEDRKAVKDYLYGKEGLYCCDIVTFNTIALKGAIKDVCRALYKNPDFYSLLSPKWKKEYDNYKKCCEHYNGQGQSFTIPEDLKAEIDKVQGGNHIKIAEEIITLAEVDENAARNKYPEVFKYVDLVNGVVVSVGNHPAGCVVSPFPVDEWFGTFSSSTDEYPISLLNMKEIDSLNFVKLDILCLDNIGLIYKTCELAGIPFLTPDNTPPDDVAVWNSIRDDTTMIFQWESQSASAYLKELLSDATVKKIKKENPNMSYMDLFSIGNGAIRPAGESYRNELSQGIYRDNGHKALNDFLASTLGYLVYQEQVIEFLHSFSGYTMGKADIVRRGFAKKSGTEKFIPDIKKGFIQQMKIKYGVSDETANQLIKNFLKVIEDASSYLFSKNHSDPYSWIGYICGYLRYYYPLEFITTALNIFEDKEDKSLAIINYAKKQGIKISPIKFRYSTAQYNFNKETKEIYKGISSIKFLNATVANEIYNLRYNRYQTFVDLLYDLKKETSINSRQLKILIDLDFFAEFGDANCLLEQYTLFSLLEGKSQMKKDKLKELNLSEELLRECAGQETKKMFKDIDMKNFMRKALPMVKYRERSLGDKITAQITHLGYLDIKDDKYAGMAVVTSLDTKYSPYLTLYSLRNGTMVNCKIDKKTFRMNKLKVGNMLSIQSHQRKPKLKRLEDGTYIPIKGDFEMWLTKYQRLNYV